VKDIASNVSKAVGATSSDDKHLSVAESSLRLDLCDDLELAEVDLEPLVDAASDLLLRTPRAAAALRANPASQHGHTHTRAQAPCSQIVPIIPRIFNEELYHRSSPKYRDLTLSTRPIA